jgi:hypothetical protein
MVKPKDRPPFCFAVQATNAAGAASGATPSEKSKTSGTQRFSSQTTTWAPVPRRRSRAYRGKISPRSRRRRLRPRSASRVFCIDYHVPAVMAKEAATLDLLSDGRLEMGIGMGWSETDYTAKGLEFDRPGCRSHGNGRRGAA